MIVDSQLNIHGLTDQEKIDLTTEVEQIIFHGKINWDSQILKEWLKQGKFEERNYLLIISTLYATRALYSIIKY